MSGLAQCERIFYKKRNVMKMILFRKFWPDRGMSHPLCLIGYTSCDSKKHDSWKQKQNAEIVERASGGA